MTIKNVTVHIPQELANELDRLHFETESRKQLIAFFINQGMDTTSEAFTDTKREYVEFFTKLEKAKFEFETKYLADYPTRIRWKLVGNTGEVTVEVGDETKN